MLYIEASCTSELPLRAESRRFTADQCTWLLSKDFRPCRHALKNCCLTVFLLNRDRGLDVGVGFIADEIEIFEPVVE
jgi:hypothetical protein